MASMTGSVTVIVPIEPACICPLPFASVLYSILWGGVAFCLCSLNCVVREDGSDRVKTSLILLNQVITTDLMWFVSRTYCGVTRYRKM